MMVELCSKVMKVPFEKQSSSKEFISLFKELSRFKAQACPNLDPSQSTVKKYIENMIGEKRKYEENRHLEAQFHYFKQLAKRYPRFLEEFEKASPFYPTFQTSQICLLSFAEYCIRENNGDHLLSKEHNSMDIILISQILLLRKRLQLTTAMFRRIILNICKQEPELMESQSTVLTALLSTIDGLCHDPLDKNILKARDEITSLKNRLSVLSSIVDSILRQFRIIYENVIVTIPNDPPSWFQKEFQIQKNLCIKKVFSTFCSLLNLDNWTPLQRISTQNDNLQTCLKSLSKVIMAFNRRYSSAPERFREYVLAWKEAYLKDYLSYLTTLFQQLESSTPPSMHALSLHLDRIKDFNFDSEIRQFQEITNKLVLRDATNADYGNPIMFIVDSVIKESHLQYKYKVVEALRKFQNFLFLFEMEEEIQFALNLQAEIRLLYPEIEEKLFYGINWDQKPKFQRILEQIVEYFHREQVSQTSDGLLPSSARISSLIESLLLMKEDFNRLYETNQAVSRLIHLDAALPIGFLEFYLAKQFELLEKVFTKAEESIQTLFTTGKFNYYAGDVSWQILVYFCSNDSTKKKDYWSQQIVNYENLLSYFISTGGKYPILQPVCQYPIRFILKAMPFFTRPTSDTVEKINQVFLSIKDIIRLVLTDISLVKDLTETIIVNCLALMPCYEDLLDLLYSTSDKFCDSLMKLWDSLLKVLGHAKNQLKDGNRILELVESWTDVCQYWPLVKEMSLEETKNVEDQDRYLLQTKILTKLYLLLALECLRPGRKHEDWLKEAVNRLSLCRNDLINDPTRKDQYFIAVIFMILKALFSVWPSQNPLVLEMISKHEANPDLYTTYSTDYSQLIIQQCGKRLVLLLNQLFAFLHERSHFPKSSYGDERNVSPFEILYPFFAVFDCLAENTSRSLVCLQQCESLIANNLTTPREANQLLSTLAWRLDNESISKNTKSQECFVEAQQFYEDVCRLYVEWRSAVQKVEDNDANTGEKLLELYQRLNLLFLSLYYCHQFLLLKKGKTIEKTWKTYEEKKNKMLQEKILHRITQKF